MAYATVADIEGEFKNIPPFTTTTPVKLSQVQAMLDEAANYIDAKVGMRYVLPITAIAALSLLKTICIDIVVERLKPLLKIDAGGAKGSQTPDGNNRQKKADKTLDEIQSNKTDLTVLGAVLRSTGDGADGYGARNKGSDGDGNSGQGSVFKKGTQQW